MSAAQGEHDEPVYLTLEDVLRRLQPSALPRFCLRVFRGTAGPGHIPGPFGATLSPTRERARRGSGSARATNVCSWPG